MRKFISLLFIFAALFTFAACENTPQTSSAGDSSEVSERSSEADISKMEQELSEVQSEINSVIEEMSQQTDSTEKSGIVLENASEEYVSDAIEAGGRLWCLSSSGKLKSYDLHIGKLLSEETVGNHGDQSSYLQFKTVEEGKPWDFALVSIDGICFVKDGSRISEEPWDSKVKEHMVSSHSLDWYDGKLVWISEEGVCLTEGGKTKVLLTKEDIKAVMLPKAENVPFMFPEDDSKSIYAHTGVSWLEKGTKLAVELASDATGTGMLAVYDVAENRMEAVMRYLEPASAEYPLWDRYVQVWSGDRETKNYRIFDARKNTTEDVSLSRLSEKGYQLLNDGTWLVIDDEKKVFRMDHSLTKEIQQLAEAENIIVDAVTVSGAVLRVTENGQTNTIYVTFEN